MNKKTAHAARLILAAATLAGMTGCCWMKCPCKSDHCPAKPCTATDSTPCRNVDLNVGAHAGTSGVGMDAGIDRR